MRDCPTGLVGIEGGYSRNLQQLEAYWGRAGDHGEHQMEESFEGGCEVAIYANYRKLLSAAHLMQSPGMHAVGQSLTSQNLDNLIQNYEANSKTSMRPPNSIDVGDLIKFGPNTSRNGESVE